MENLTFSLSKGRLTDDAVALFDKIGLKTNIDNSRKLVFQCGTNTFFLSKPGDVPTYVEYGAADVGIAGKDTILEEKRNVYEILDLGIGRCIMAVAGNKEIKNYDFVRVATKYPNIAKDYFDKRNQKAEIIKLNGSVELGCIVGLADVIVDIVESGRTLEENNLYVLEKICDISARVIVNKASLNVKHEAIWKLINNLKNVRECEGIK
ncbi:MAG: ATP phosphoribosyltransferase [Fusobacteriaceae bacterium]|jgi:ATP phosphoribosyltransferase|nr:ATP phosphoribosyltransferase [Fusobacteriaceae bacterium]